MHALILMLALFWAGGAIGQISFGPAPDVSVGPGPSGGTTATCTYGPFGSAACVHSGGGWVCPINPAIACTVHESSCISFGPGPCIEWPPSVPPEEPCISFGPGPCIPVDPEPCPEPDPNVNVCVGPAPCPEPEPPPPGCEPVPPPGHWVCVYDGNNDGAADDPGETAECVAEGAVWICPLNRATPCGNLDANPPVVNPDPLPTADDGRRDAGGMCLDQVSIFEGRAMRCQLSGTQNGFNDCCEDSDGVYNDSVGSLNNLRTGVSVIRHTYGMVSAAYQAYQAEVAIQAVAGQAAGAPALAAQAAAEQYIAALFNPATIAIAVAVYIIVEFMTRSCDQTDIETAMLRASGYCVELGEYCRVKWFGSCVQKAIRHCCFNSKLARIVQEQGRPQLVGFGGFGTPDAPNCRGFTPAEFQALDFGKIDLSEYYGELQGRAQALIRDDLTDGVQRFYDQIP